MFEHGGDTVTYEMEYGKKPLDFSANVSPLGFVPEAADAVRKALSDAASYPDPFCRKLTAALSEKTGVPQAQILCGNGASDLIWRLVYAKRPAHALTLAPGFAEYERALIKTGCEVTYIPLSLEDDFHLTDAVLSMIDQDLDMIFLCQPNNPTGLTIEMPLLKKILQKCAQYGVFLVMDECFVAFLDEPADHTLLPELASHDMMIVNAFTKWYGMAGLRLGYCMCRDTDLLQRMRESGPPWAVSGIAQAAGIAALWAAAYEDELHSLIRKERGWLIAELQNCGFRVIPGEANFLLFQGPLTLAQDLMERGILIRDCSNFKGLEKGWYRIAVRTHEENAQLIRTIREVVR